jgi:transcription elongation factor GreB
MSKAFLRESDSEEITELPPVAVALPPGARNYVTPSGLQRLQNELARLADQVRPGLASQSDDPDAKRQLQVVDQRLRRLRDSLQTAEVVVPPSPPDDVVRVGATVTVREPEGDRSRYRIVGVDETDPDQGWVSWVSPVGRALLNAREGDRVGFRAPAGTRELVVERVEYEPVVAG